MRAAKRRLVDMTDAFTPEGIAKLKKGQILVFMKDGERQEYRIISKAGGKVFGRPTKTYTEDEAKRKWESGDARS